VQAQGDDGTEGDASAWRDTPRSLQRSDRPDPSAPPPILTRVIPEKIIPDDDTFGTILDCESYALLNKDQRFNQSMAHSQGRRKRNVTTTFGQKSE